MSQRQQHWSWWEHGLLRAGYAALPTSLLARALGRTETGVKSRARVLGITRGVRHYWTPREDALLRKLYPNTPSRQLANRFRCALYSLNQRAARLGLKKSKAYMQALDVEEGRRLIAFGRSHRFQKGIVPHNKGLRRPGWYRGRMRETQFKKGSLPQTTLPIGTVKFNTDGYLIRKVSERPNDGTPSFKRNWEFVHKRVWEDAHGPIPPGHRIWWKDGNHANCALENLELLSDAEHMARTTVHNLPPELKQVIQLTGALKRKIRNRKEKLHAQEQGRGPAQPSVRNVGVAERLRA